MPPTVPLWVNIFVLVISSLGGLSALGALLQARRQAQKTAAEAVIELDALNDRVLARTKDLLDRQSAMLDSKKLELEIAHEEIAELRKCRQELEVAIARIKVLEERVDELTKG